MDKKLLFTLFYILLHCSYLANAQMDSSLLKKIKFTADFKFRTEQDWDSRKGDGSYRPDRAVLRYRARFGLSYQYNKWASFGMRVRSGNLIDQQGVPITFGAGTGEFGLSQVGFDKAYLKAEHKNLTAWIGKNDTPFYKQNELFWSDHALPEGIAVSVKIPVKATQINSLNLNMGHFIVKSNGKSLVADNYFEGIQLLAKLFKNRLTVFPSFYYFNNLPNLPDGIGQYNIRYSIIHTGAKLVITPKNDFNIHGDIYKNTQDLTTNVNIPSYLADQKNGFVVGVGRGNLKQKGKWQLNIDYAHLQKYSIVDYFAQNDWSRLDYSGLGAAGARLSNFQGIDYSVGYAIGDKFNVVLRGFSTKQLLLENTKFNESGNRLRLDLTIGF